MACFPGGNFSTILLLLGSSLAFYPVQDKDGRPGTYVESQWVEHIFFQHTKVKQKSFVPLLSSYQMHLIQRCHVSESVIYFLPHLHTHYFPLSRASVTATAVDSNTITFTEDMFGPVGRLSLNVKLLCRSDECQPLSPRQQPGLSVAHESTRPKDKPARHTKPGALIIQSGR